MGNPKKANAARFYRVSSMIQMYQMDHTKLPSTLGELTTLKYLSQKEIQDIWGQEFVIKNAAGGKFQLQSLGADEKSETANDLFDP